MDWGVGLWKTQFGGAFPRFQHSAPAEAREHKVPYIPGHGKARRRTTDHCLISG